MKPDDATGSLEVAAVPIKNLRDIRFFALVGGFHPVRIVAEKSGRLLVEFRAEAIAWYKPLAVRGDNFRWRSSTQNECAVR